MQSNAAVKLLLAAWARCEDEASGNQKLEMQEMRRNWGRLSSQFIGEHSKPSEWDTVLSNKLVALYGNGMRREDFKVLDVPISVQIHTPRIIEQQDNGDDVFDIESTLSPQMKDSIAKFTGSGVQIDKMRDILHHVSLFYSCLLYTSPSPRD